MTGRADVHLLADVFPYDKGLAAVRRRNPDGLDSLRSMFDMEPRSTTKRSRTRRTTPVARKPGAREQSGGDCCAIAAEQVLGASFDDALDELGEHVDSEDLQGWMTDRGHVLSYDYRDRYQADLRRHRRGEPRLSQLTVRALARDCPTGAFYCCTNGHAYAMRDGVVLDDRVRPGAVVLLVWEVTP